MQKRLTGVLGSLAVLTMVTLLACENSSTPVESPQGVNPLTSTAPMVMGGQTIGEIHNEAMEAVYHALARANRNGKLTAKAGCEIARNALRTFFREKGLLQGAAHQFRMDNGLRNAGCKDTSGGVDRMGTASYEYASPYEAISQSGLSTAAQNYLYQISDAVSYGSSTAAIQSQIWSIEQQALGALTSAEAQIVSATASVAASSIEYWDANFESWYYANNGGSLGGGGKEPVLIESVGSDGEIRIMGFWDGAKRIVAGDVGGAVAGAVAGMWAGGVGAGPGALAGGAGGSAGAATLELLRLM